MKDKILDFLVNKIIARISYWVGRLTGEFSYKAISGDEFHQARELLKSGDVICTVNRHAWFSNTIQKILTGAEWFHCGIYDKENFTIYEATEFGVKRSSVFEFFASKDKFVILRPNLFGEVQDPSGIIEKALNYAAERVGLPYDYAFDFSESSNDSYYCSELIWKAFKEATKGESPFELRLRYGVPTATPQDIVNARSKFVRVYKSEGLSYSDRIRRAR
jgi:uncharacterized protein YycO